MSTTKQIKELIMACFDKANRINARLNIEYVGCHGVTIFITTSDCDFLIIKASKNYVQTVDHIKSALAKVKEL